MQTFKLTSPQPEAGTDVTRLWLGPGLVRIGAVLGNTIQHNGVGLCWDTTAQRALWEADIQDSVDTCSDPDFDRDLTRVFFPRVSGGYGEDREATLAVREIASGAAVPLGGSWSHLPALTPDGRYAVACAVPEGNVARELRRWRIPAGLNAADELNPDRKWTIRLPPGRSIIQQLDNILVVLAVSPDGRLLTAGKRNGAITVWNFANRRQVASAPEVKLGKYARSSVHRLVFSSDGTRLAALRGKRMKKQYGFVISVWAIPGGKQLKGPKEKVSVNGMAFSPDGRTLLTAREDGRIGVWDTATWKLRHEYAWKIGKLFSVAFSPDGLTCAAGGENGQVVVWDVDL